MTVDDLPEYPMEVDARLTSHFWFTFHHDRFLNSRFRLLADPEVRAYGIDLWCFAQKQTPVGTLPDDDAELAALLGLDLRTWQGLRAREISPLYKWHRCLCGNQVRLMHETVLEVVVDAMERRDRNKLAATKGAERKRQARLSDAIRKAGGSRRMAEDPGVLERLDTWLREYCDPRGNRTIEWVKRAMEVDASKDHGPMN
ncbi:hypothetical protein [Palleronia sp. LCG004]|uniref:hypothetical protein n=1 Tax=Palleronia sp. LCG004 TaxID=3079304 RepID=UPI002941CE16|nr:hypothetical protein [Palleronia sp. LCG004]WOI54972.1 hypothetical protein RVY76_07795 [Palleronia sp. LCG004]